MATHPFEAGATARALGLAALGVLAFWSLAAGSARAERLENQVAVFAALDKVTARISPKLAAPLGETVTFGALKVTPRICYSRPPTEPPKTTAFVEVDEIGIDGEEKRLFTGWMFAESPGLNAVEHPVFDVWLTSCEKPQRSLARRERGSQPEAGGERQEPAAEPEEDPVTAPRRRVRR